MEAEFLTTLFAIIAIDLVFAGDNAILSWWQESSRKNKKKSNFQRINDQKCGNGPNHD